MSRNLSNRDHEPKGRAISTADSHTGTGDGITDDDLKFSIINVYSLRSRADQGDGRQHDFNGEMKIKTEAIDEDSSQGEVGSKMAEYYQRNVSTAPHKALHSAHVKEEPCDSPQESGSNVCTPDNMACASTSVSLKTRAQDNVYLIGSTSGDAIKGAKLPTVHQSLVLFFHHLKKENRTARESATLTIEEVVKFWEKAHLPTTTKQHCIHRLERLYEEWRSLQKGAKRGGATQEKKEASFKASLEKTFDLRHADSEAIITNPEDRKFLHDQFSERKASMGSVDTVLEAKTKRKKEREEKEKTKAEKENKRQEMVMKGATAMEVTDSDSDSETTAQAGSSSSDGSPE
uniref:uncharacterized protein isoform X2 n=1 Tax=Myxine glutinosa TaxID=7769 RepID=UPI00358FD0B7